MQRARAYPLKLLDYAWGPSCNPNYILCYCTYFAFSDDNSSPFDYMARLYGYS